MSSSSSTVTVVQPAAEAAAGEGGGAGEEAPPKQLTLKLRARRRRVRWADDVVDNEDLGRKRSKCCCQYHRPRAFDESSDEEEIDHLRDCVHWLGEGTLPPSDRPPPAVD